MRERGFTMTELMITLAIIFTLSAVSAPSLSRWVTNTRFTSTTNALTSTLQLARIKAITQNASVRLLFDLPERTYQLQQRVTVNPDRWQDLDKVKKLPADVQIVSISSNPIVFQSGRGSTPVGGNSTIRMETPQGRRADVVVAQTGRVRVERF